MIALVAALILAASPLPGGYQSAKWGMSPAETEKTLGFRKSGNTYGALATVGADQGFVRAYYADGKLAIVTVEFFGEAHQRLRDLLIEKYGEPTRTVIPDDVVKRLTEGVMTEWDDGANRIEIRDSAVVTLTYASKALEPAARKAEEERRQKAKDAEKAKKLQSL